jgi:aspartyl-tRNA(Asn)/glutamyl-tRNA(Gln) amidotransferase subunit A
VLTTRPPRLDIAAAAELIARREVSPVELLRNVLAQIERLEPRVRAFAHLLPDQALAAAGTAERQLLKDTSGGPLLGIPVALKDLIDTAGVPTTWGSAAHAGRVPTQDAEVWRRLRNAGAILLGKSMTHEMGCGTLCPPTSNPWALDRGPGGSSGGSAAALAAGLCLGALGTDTGGSIRIPAACTGTVGLKPTFGLVPREGVMSASWSLDHVGPMATSVQGVAFLLDALLGAGAEPSLARTALEDGVRGLRLGVAGGWFRERVQPDVAAAVDQAIRVLTAEGAHLVDVDLDSPLMAASASIGSLIALPELALLHGQDLRRHPDLLGEQVRLNLELGLVEPATAYVGALRARLAIQHTLRDCFERHQLAGLLTPTLPVTAARKEQTAIDFGPDDAESPEAAYVRFCVAFNLAGLPALSLPCGLDRRNLPIGLQIVGRPFVDGMVLRIGHVYERATAWHDAVPPVV